MGGHCSTAQTTKPTELTQRAMNCATTNRRTLEQHPYSQGISVCSPAIYRLSA